MNRMVHVKSFLILLLLASALGVIGCERNESSGTLSAMETLVSHSPVDMLAPTFRAAFYVAPNGNDANKGSVSSPWATLQHAADIAGAGAVVHVAPGNYSAVATRRSGSAGARIRFISDVKWAARIRSTGVQQAWFNNGNYVDIMGFDISGDGRLGILNLGSFVRMIGNHVHDIPATPCTSDGGAGIDDAEYTAGDDDIIGNVVHDIGNLSVSCRHVHGIYHSNARGHILNNITYRNQGWGIHLWHAADDVVIANNLVFANREGGIIVGAGDSPGGITASRMTVVNNIVLDHPNAIGIYEYGQTGTNNRYAHNLIWKNARGIVLQNGLRAADTIERDPGLIDYRPDGHGDYHLRAQSPAVKAGTNVDSPVLDIDGARRPGNLAPDLGPFQFAAKDASWPWM